MWPEFHTKDFSTHLQFVLLPVDNDGCNLLVHEDEYGAEESRDEGDDGGPPGVGPHGVYNPATIIPGRLWQVRKKHFKCISSELNQSQSEDKEHH